MMQSHWKLSSFFSFLVGVGVGWAGRDWHVTEIILGDLWSLTKWFTIITFSSGWARVNWLNYPLEKLTGYSYRVTKPVKNLFIIAQERDNIVWTRVDQEQADLIPCRWDFFTFPKTVSGEGFSKANSKKEMIWKKTGRKGWCSVQTWKHWVWDVGKISQVEKTNRQLETLIYNINYIMDSEKEMFFHYLIWNCSITPLSLWLQIFFSPHEKKQLFPLL